MTLQDIVTCKETSQKLAEVELPQEGGVAYWFPYVVIEDDPNSINRAGIKVTDKQVWLPVLAETEMKSKTGKMVLENAIKEGTIYRAWSFSELWEILPSCIYKVKHPKSGANKLANRFSLDLGKTKEGKSVIVYEHNCGNGTCLLKVFSNKQPHEAAAELLLWCKNEGYLNV